MVIQENISLQAYHSFGCEELVAYFTTISKKEDLLACIEFSKQQQIPLRIIGSGTNLLISNKVNALIAKMEITGIKKIDEDANSVRLAVGAGENWHHFVGYCVQKSWGGIENLSMIPGTVGASAVQNINAFGVEVSECIHCVIAYDCHTSQWVRLNTIDCAFKPYNSIFQKEKGRYIITEVEFELKKQPILRMEDGALRDALYQQGIKQPNLASISLAIIQLRNSSFPRIQQLASAGKCFHNPIASKEQVTALRNTYPDIKAYPISDNDYEIAADWLLVKSDWFLQKRGSNTATKSAIQCYEKNPLYIINAGNATGHEINAFIHAIEQSVLDQFGIPFIRAIETI